jgi:hypothetical protein
MRDLPNEYEFDDPAVTLELLSELEGLGLTDDAFAVMHHFEKPERIASHRNYCMMIKEEGGNFRTATNRLLQRRLELVLKILTLTDIKNRNPRTFLTLSELSILEHPHAAKNS